MDAECGRHDARLGFGDNPGALQRGPTHTLDVPVAELQHHAADGNDCRIQRRDQVAHHLADAAGGLVEEVQRRLLAPLRSREQV